METNLNVKYPCRNCKYFNCCGDSGRTALCMGRELATVDRTKRAKQKIVDAYFRNLER